MPVIFYFLLAILFLASLRIKKHDVFFDKDSSDTIKGFFILLIVFSHILNDFPYAGVGAIPLERFRIILGQLCVSMFFFISGYGIIYSIETKKDEYSKSVFTNRFLRIILYTSVGLVPYFIYSAFLRKEHYFSDYFLALIGLRSFGNETWFIFAILVCYLICSIVYLVNWKRKYVPVVLVSVGVVGYIFSMYFLKQPAHTWNTVVCFIYGITVALFRDKINVLLSKNKSLPYILMVISIVMVISFQWIVNGRYAQFFPEIIEMWFANAFFCLFFVCLTKVFTLKSSVLSYLGKASYAIFLSHRIVISCFVDIGTIPNEHLNYLVLFIASILVGIPIFYIYKVVDKYITNPIVEWNRNIIRRNSV